MTHWYLTSHYLCVVHSVLDCIWFNDLHFLHFKTCAIVIGLLKATYLLTYLLRPSLTPKPETRWYSSLNSAFLWIVRFSTISARLTDITEFKRRAQEFSVHSLYLVLQFVQCWRDTLKTWKKKKNVYNSSVVALLASRSRAYPLQSSRTHSLSSEW